MNYFQTFFPLYIYKSSPFAFNHLLVCEKIRLVKMVNDSENSLVMLEFLLRLESENLAMLNQEYLDER